MRKQTFLQPRDEHSMEFQALRGMHRHQLQRLGACSGLMLASFERGMRQKSSECRKFLWLSLPFLGLRNRTVGGNESNGGIGQFAKILESILAFAFVLVMRDQSAQLNHMVDDLRQR